MPLLQLLDVLDRDAGLFQPPGGAFGGHELIAHRDQPRGQADHVLLGRLRATLMKIVPSLGSTMPAATWLLAKAIENRSLTPITSPVERISGPEHDVDAGEFREREHALLDRDVAGDRVASCSPARPATRRPSPWRRSWPPACPWPWRRTARCGWPADSLPARRAPAGRLLFLIANWMFISPTTLQLPGQRVRGLANLGQDRAGAGCRAESRRPNRRSGRPPLRCAP